MKYVVVSAKDCYKYVIQADKIKEFPAMKKYFPNSHSEVYVGFVLVVFSAMAESILTRTYVQSKGCRRFLALLM